MVQQPTYWRVLTRRKVLRNDGIDDDTKLNRILGLWDLTALGVGSTLGAGVYVLAGQIAKEQAGPAVMISFAIAALSSLLAGLCYAEFGARVPKAGSAYIYSYVCIGEFAAFVIGWNLILEYMIGTASVCRGISLYLDTLLNDALKNAFASIAPMNVSFLGSYFDFFAFGLVIVFGIALAFGVETSAMANNCCTCLNLFILLFVIIAGSVKSNLDNWTIDVASVNATHVTSDLGKGGYFPFGIAGVLKGAATCFFGFVGFDCIATTGEEVRQPRRNIPYSILLSLLIIFLCYFGVSTVLTLMVPYYQQNANAPLPYAFEAVGWPFAMWIVAVGGLVGLLASLFGALFPLPRVMYSMAEDGLLFRFLGKISLRYRVPVVGSIFAAMITALMAGIFDLAQLVSLLSIGTLLAYSVVAISITILRYMEIADENRAQQNGHATVSENSLLTSTGQSRVTFSSVLLQLFNLKRLPAPTSLSTHIVGTLIAFFCLLSAGIGLLVMHAYDSLISNQIWALVLLIVLIVLSCLVLLAICLQPREARSGLFRVPYVPIVPALSIFINIYLMLQLDATTWIRFGVWMLIGLLMYFGCGAFFKPKASAARLNYAKLLLADRKARATKHQQCNGHALFQSSASNETHESSTHTNGLSLTKSNSMRSLNEIHNLSDVCNNLIEMKHPNGKVFYVADTKSSSSSSQTTQTMEQNGSDVLGGNSAVDHMEEEKSVIAMLDDVLKEADPGTPMSPIIDLTYYDRKISVDSALVPSMIAVNTVATVHSCDDIYLDVLAELEPDTECELVLDEQMARETAEEMLQQIFTDERLLATLELSEAKCSAAKVDAANAATAQLRQRGNSFASLASLESIEQQPLHSDKFKDKLSQLIMRNSAGPTLPMPRKAKPHDEQSCESNEPPSLQQSKSETDLRQLLLRAIADTDMKLPENQLEPMTAVPATASVLTGVPKPPKFDPVLYKTITAGQFKRQHERAPLTNMTDVTIVKTPSDRELATETEVPFKLKLEAILKRGPSHRTQKASDMPGSFATLDDHSKHNENHIPNGAIKLQVETAYNQLNATEAVNDVRKSLRHIENGYH